MKLKYSSYLFICLSCFFSSANAAELAELQAQMQIMQQQMQQMQQTLQQQQLVIEKQQEQISQDPKIAQTETIQKVSAAQGISHSIVDSLSINGEMQLIPAVNTIVKVAVI